MKQLKLGRIFQYWLDNGNRFPLASFVAHLGTLCAVALVFWRIAHPQEETISSILMACIVIFPLAILVPVLYRQNTQKLWIAHTNLILAGVGVAFLLNQRFVHFNSDWAAMSFVLLAAGSHLLFACVAYLRNADSHHFWEFNRQALAHLFTGLLYSFALWASVGAAILAIDKLFELHIDGEVYGVWSMLSWGLMSTGYFMAMFPKDLAYSKEEMVFDRAYLSLTKYLFVPISLLYFLILYAYGLKIAFQWQLPHGWVASLCIGFSLAGVVTWLLNFFLPEWYQSSLLAAFKRWFWVLTIPIVLLLIVAIGRRMSDYGITEERYVVAMIAGCFTLNALYYVIVPRIRQRLWFLPLSVAIAAVLTAFGPFDARSVSLRNQSRQLVQLLTDAGVYQSGRVVVPEKEVEVPTILFDKVDYLATRDSNRLYNLLGLDDATRQVMLTEFGTISGYALGKALRLNSSDLETRADNYFNFSNAAFHQSYEIPKGAFLRLRQPTQLSDDFAYSGLGYALQHSVGFDQLVLTQDKLIVDTLDLTPIYLIISDLRKKSREPYVNDTLSTCLLQGKRYQVVLYPESLNGRVDSGNDKLEYVNGDYYLIKNASNQ